MYPLDTDRLQLPEESRWSGEVLPSKLPPRHKPGERFLKGPIPWGWLTRAARLPGRALHIALALWFKAGAAKTRMVPLSYEELAELGCKRETARRGLGKLEGEGLVSVDRHPGRCPRVTILEARETPHSDDGG